MDTERFRRAETLRLLEWIRDNRDCWKDVCLSLTGDDALINTEYRDVIRELRNSGFYQIIVVLLYSNNECIREMMESALINEIGRCWSDTLFDKIMDSLLDNIK